MKIGVYYNPIKDPTGAVRDAVFAAAEHNGIVAESYAAGERYDFIVSVGGDGTILRIAKDSAKSGIPILGINKGTVGFLTETEPDDITTAIKRLKARDYVLERRALIDATHDGKHYYALNDIVVRSTGVRMIAMEVRVAGEIIDKFTCDGYIACTPTGSTAYSLSAGGSVIGPNTPVIALTPVNPHTLRTRPIVVGSFEQIQLKNTGLSDAGVYVDGEHIGELAAGGSVAVTGWDMSALFVRFGKKSFYSRLLDKLNAWSATED
ncbi:MAG: NAD(+)/NADH kinase [Clostridiales bacterium]|nr:NAD(+)/NADH kinase [Clostridiales bacterium]